MQRSEMTFQKGSILRKEMLEDLYTYPRFVVEGYFDSYSDGILYGLEWKENREKEGHHIISPGALKLHGNIYFQTTSIDVEEYFQQEEQAEVDQRYRLFFLEREEPETEPSRTIYELELSLIQSAELEKAKQCGFYYAYVEYIGQPHRFQMIEDAKLAYGLYAANDGAEFRFSPVSLEQNLQKILEKKKQKCYLDYQFLQDIYERKGISVCMAELYLRESGAEQEQIETWKRDPIALLAALQEACENYEMTVHVTEIKELEKESEQTKETEIYHEQGALL